MKQKENKKLIGRSAIEWSEKLWDQFLEKLVHIDSKNELKDTLEKLISSDEKNMILRRLAVVALIRAGKSYREIGEILWLSHPTISTIKKNIFGSSRNYKSYRAFYGGPVRWSGEVKIEKSFWENFFSLANNNLGLLDLFVNPPRPKGLGMKDRYTQK